MFKPDQPIERVKDDLLGTGPFARALGEAVLKYTSKESMVIALYGPWGSGKTSIVNMALEHIGNISKEETDKPIIMRFNPWNFSEQNQLILQFFGQLSNLLNRPDWAGDFKKAGKRLKLYADCLRPLAIIPIPVVGQAAATIASSLDKIGDTYQKVGKSKSEDLASLKNELANILRKQHRKIIVVIDDIDRLNLVEIRQIFQLVKCLGDFPNTVYLLAFDKGVVTGALKGEQGDLGEKYLEKVVQVPFEIPLADRQEIERLLFSQLDQLIGDIPEERWEQVYWGNIYHSGLKYFFNSIRDVTRYINSLRLSFEMVKGEVNAIDFLAITGLQVFLPDIYAGIRDNKDIFAGASRDRGGQTQRDEERKRCDDILNKGTTVEQDQLRDFMKRLFPRLEAVYGGANYGSNWLDNWRKAGRICSPDIFDTFFRLSLPKNEISQKEILRILSTAKDEMAFIAL